MSSSFGKYCPACRGFFMDKTTALIAKHEGLRLTPYRCSAGKLSIGYGRNLDDVGISMDEANAMLKADVSTAYAEAGQFEWFRNLNDPRQAAITNMIFNLGLPRFKGFSNTLIFLAQGDYENAADEILRGTGPGGKSRWYVQVGPRAEEISEILRTGEWPDD